MNVMSFYVDKSQCSHHTIFPGVDIYTMAGETMMISLVEMQPHAIVQEHSHPHEQMGYLLEGEAEFTIGGITKTLRPCEMWRIPGHVKHRVVAGAQPVRAIDIFHPIREDYR